MQRRYLEHLEAESIFILREVAAQFKNPALLYSVGKDSSVLLHLCKKAFFPASIPFSFVHIDTGFKFPEMYEFRDATLGALNLKLIVHSANEQMTLNPFDLGTERCCQLLKTNALLSVLQDYNFDAAIGGARRDEERSRAKERIFSLRNHFGQWEPRNQRPELWNLYNGSIGPQEHMRVFPLSHWTELDIWHYAHLESIELVPLYFAKPRPVIKRGGMLLPAHDLVRPQEEIITRSIRYRSLGCMPCSGAIESQATSIPLIIEELTQTQQSERALRIIDHESDASMEQKKTEGYF